MWLRKLDDWIFLQRVSPTLKPSCSYPREASVHQFLARQNLFHLQYFHFHTKLPQLLIHLLKWLIFPKTTKKYGESSLPVVGAPSHVVFFFHLPKLVNGSRSHHEVGPDHHWRRHCYHPFRGVVGVGLEGIPSSNDWSIYPFLTFPPFRNNDLIRSHSQGRYVAGGE